MLTWDRSLFYLTFLGQIYLLSYYFPEKILGRMQNVLSTYPPKEYPKLYPTSIESHRIGRQVFKVISRLILFLGFIVLFAVITLDDGSIADDGGISEAWPAAYGMLQFLPLMLLEFAEYSQFKLMRQANSTTTRKAGTPSPPLLRFRITDASWSSNCSLQRHRVVPPLRQRLR